MSRLSYAQKRIRACDRILRRLYWELRRAMRYYNRIDTDEDKLQEDINWFEAKRDQIEISL
jgi:hypothetical protein